MALFLYTRVTYLFREVSCSRDTITGFEEEEKLDVVCIGSSTIVEYYQPLTAWKNYGYTLEGGYEVRQKENITKFHGELFAGVYDFNFWPCRNFLCQYNRI